MLPGNKQANATAESGLAARDGVVFIASSASVTTYTMKETDYSVYVTTTSGNAMAVTLPNAALASGRIYSVFSKVDGGGGATVTVAAPNSDTMDTVTITTANSYGVFYSNGVNWFTLGSDTNG